MAFYKDMEAEQFVEKVSDLKKSGKTENEIAKELEFSDKVELRSMYQLALKTKAINIGKRYRSLKEAGYSRDEIAKMMNIPKSTLRAMDDKEVNRIAE